MNICITCVFWNVQLSVISHGYSWAVRDSWSIISHIHILTNYWSFPTDLIGRINIHITCVFWNVQLPINNFVWYRMDTHGQSEISDLLLLYHTYTTWQTTDHCPSPMLCVCVGGGDNSYPTAFLSKTGSVTQRTGLSFLLSVLPSPPPHPSPRPQPTPITNWEEELMRIVRIWHIFIDLSLIPYTCNITTVPAAIFGVVLCIQIFILNIFLYIAVSDVVKKQLLHRCLMKLLPFWESFADAEDVRLHIVYRHFRILHILICLSLWYVT